VFDDAGVPVEYGDVHVNSTSPRLTLRRSDVDANDLGQRGIAVVVNGVSYAVREHLPGDAPGWSILILSKP
jgi:hypothetical protein